MMGQDYLVYKRGQMEIPTETIDDIVALKTTPLDLSKDPRDGLMDHLQGIISEKSEGPAFVHLE